MVIHSPRDLAQAIGNFTCVEPRPLRAQTTPSDADRVTAHFWFDPRDPERRHRLELVVNDARVDALDLDVVAA